MGILSLVLGIISLFLFPFISGSAAIIFGVIGLNNYDEGSKDRKLATAGIALGAFSVAVQILFLLMLSAI